MLAQRPDGDQRSADVDGHLDDVGPDDGGHSALEGVEQRERGDDGDGEHVSGADGDADHDGDGEDADAFGCGAGEQEEARGDLVERVAEAAVDELIGGQHLALEVFWQEERGDDDAAEHVADDDLQEAEVAGEGEAGRADDGEGARFRRRRWRARWPTRERFGRPGSSRAAICRCRRAAPGEAQSEERNRHQVQPNHAEIERMQANRHCLSIAIRYFRPRTTDFPHIMMACDELFPCHRCGRHQDAVPAGRRDRVLARASTGTVKLMRVSEAEATARLRRCCRGRRRRCVSRGRSREHASGWRADQSRGARVGRHRLSEGSGGS